MSELRGRPFQPGNTFGRGRPKGSRNKTTKKMKELLEKYSESIFQKCMSMALKGDRVALKLCVERVFPAKPDGYIQMPLPRTQTVQDLAESSQKVIQAIARGNITPADGEAISRILGDQRRLIECVEWEARIEALEQSGKKRGNHEQEFHSPPGKTGIQPNGPIVTFWVSRHKERLSREPTHRVRLI